MTSLLISNIQTEWTFTKVAGGPADDWRIPSGGKPQGQDRETVSFVQYNSDFAKIVSRIPKHALLLSSSDSARNAFFHSGCAHLIESVRGSGDSGGGSNSAAKAEVLYTVSDYLQPTDSSQRPVVLISRIELWRGRDGDIDSVEWTKLRSPPHMAMPTDAIPYHMQAQRGSRRFLGVLYCTRPHRGPTSNGGLFFMRRGKHPVPLVTSYYGREFNVVRNAVHRSCDGSLWFTESCTGMEQEECKEPRLPCQLYCFDPDTGNVRVVADGLKRPAGVCFSVDEATLYITDTGSLEDPSTSGGSAGGSIFSGFGTSNDQDQKKQQATTIYAYDVLYRAGSSFLTNKRVFAYSLHGAATAIQCDTAGNVYVGCAAGLEVWNAGGVLLGVIKVPGGVTSFCFARSNELFLCSNHQVWWLYMEQI
ncbi:hypothetical protein SEPCBS119000_004707 [Sporothrix epigloea]|uniref:SMP-30/Gluconolactonase/LRE-like region domain-containing protein n=1 Tax=Sporothrix epigloea TaxID=1892477 RepID=A0ABP0DXD5_9PEZI